MKRRQVAAADIGGTHARFALATIENGAVVALDQPLVLNTGDFENFEGAWGAFGHAGVSAAAVAIAGPVLGGRVKMTNGPWTIDIAQTKAALGLEAITVINDFGAVAHAAARAPADQFVHVAGPDQPLPAKGTISVIGPGTGLGVAYLHRHAGGYHVRATEGGHIGFAPQDELDDRILADLRARHGRVATERIHAGPGIVHIHSALGGSSLDERAIWERGIARQDGLATWAVDRFCASLGTVAGDYALAHGASAVVLAGGIGQRLRDVLPGSEFGERFRAKPRYEAMMAAIPIKLIIHPQPGLYGAAAAFVKEHG